MEKFLHKFLSVFLSSFLFIFPFFFLNLTQEYFVTNKIYLLGFVILFLVLISSLEILVSKKISWKKRPFDGPVLFFLITLAISVILASPNKIQAVLNPSFGLMMMVFLGALYFYLSRIQINFYKFLQISTVLLSVLAIVFFFQPFKNISLPQNFLFLKNPGFSPIGSQLDLAIFLGFFVIVQAINLIKKPVKILDYAILLINIVGLSLTVYSFIRPVVIVLPPLRLSWFASLEILKNPQTALFGIGLDNFNSVFTRVKDFTYNQSPLWQINSFNVSRSGILQIFTEAGILGFSAFVLLISSVFHYLLTKYSNRSLLAPLVYWLIVALIFPTSLIVWFLFFLFISEIKPKSDSTVFADLTEVVPLYAGLLIGVAVLLTGLSYLMGRSYASEYRFKKSLDGIVANSAKQVYDNQRQAIILNPYIERFRSNFAQTNLLIANNLAQKEPKNITENDRQTIAQAIQAAISEGKTVVSLNPQRAVNWQSLALIYLNVINAAQGADVWSVSSFQRAILLDPQNPSYRVELGGVYYSLQRYDEALKFFEQAVSLKPDWPNANYNYAWANFQKGNYDQAVNAMQNTLNLIDPKTNKTDYEKVQKELEQFKKKLSDQSAEINQETTSKSENLNLPTEPTTQISPKLALPKESAP